LILLALREAYIIVLSEITNLVILPMTLSIFFLSFALGPLFIAPISEMYGRKWVICSLIVFISAA